MYHYWIIKVIEANTGVRQYANLGPSGPLPEFACSACNQTHNLPPGSSDSLWHGLQGYSDHPSYAFFLGESEPLQSIPKDSGMRLRCQYCLTHFASDNTLRPKGDVAFSQTVKPWSNPCRNIHLTPPPAFAVQRDSSRRGRADGHHRCPEVLEHLPRFYYPQSDFSSRAISISGQEGP